MLLQILVVLLSTILLTLILTTVKKKPKPQRNMNRTSQEVKKTYSSCPICKTPLLMKEKVQSHLYPGKPDGIMHIFGCPHCQGPQTDPNAIRYCPYCKMKLRKDDYVIARVFEKPEKTQVHILGCTQCREKGLS